MEDNKNFSYEENIKTLRKIVQELQAGTLDFETGMERFRTGMTLAGECRNYLSAQELEVEKIIVSETGELSAVPFEREG